MEPALQISVIGASRCRPGSETAAAAERVGALLAEAGVTVVCGGRGGVMEAAARGAAEAGGSVLGVLPGESVDDANPHCTHLVATGVGQARNLAVVASGRAAIAIGGEWGTLSEIALARRLGRTVVCLGGWTMEGRGEMAAAPGVMQADSPEQAVRLALGAT